MSADYWTKKYLAATKRAETAERDRDNLRSKVARQRDDIMRLTRAVESLQADKAALRFDLHKERARRPADAVMERG